MHPSLPFKCFFFLKNQIFVSDEESNSPCAVRGLGRSSVVGVHAQYAGGAPLNPHRGVGQTGYFKQARICEDKVEKTELKVSL